ncbi:bifunctional lysylphosphatidylglycerol flippase/synthetase MprF [Permianibacter sp. IMCC34836]|uniref:bifunctional lysylphosphatidylglycerol flippase/synthetase MprF n=1 Tax=Permianibacter fluminis TaxID=2738515 RepID=UPI001554980F|nr:bifunctional lysylphosphatidylglycerol flippase/synthetase MprF [Permianibacter fluminis]NQD35708.1 bifunctional lysylphosphatidylglycerol flippase/synthetase MprF [Permianibacter fluminis]
MRWRTLLGALISLGLLVFAISFLVRIAQQYKYEEIVAHLHDLPWWQIGMALASTVASYLLLTCYDGLAVMYLRRKLHYRRIALASFVGYTFSHNLGFALLTGSSVRYRLYSMWGLKPAEIAQLVMFCSITFFLGLFAMGGIALLYAPPTLPAEMLAEHAWAAQLGDALFEVMAWIGIGCALAYLAIPLFWRRPLLIRGVEIRFPGFGLSLGQLLIAGIDWVLACSVLYALLPPDTRPDFLHVLTIFMAGNILGVMLHVPGGIGVFEAVVTALLSPIVPTPQLLGALVAYRVTYYLLPFVTALLLFGGHEVFRVLKRAGEGLQPASRSLMASILALAVFLGGAILLFSGATPTGAKRLLTLTELLPLWLLEATHFLAALAAVSLLLLARSLLRHSRNGFELATKILPLAAILAVAKGLQYEVAIFLLLIWLALLPSGIHFTRRRSVSRSPFGNAWLVAIGSVIAISIWLTYFSYRHIPTDLEPWWQVALQNEQARSLRALLTIPLGFVLLALARVFRPARRVPIAAATAEQIRAIVHGSAQALSQLALLGDKRFVVSTDRSALLMYVAQDRSLVALGDPMGADDEYEELLWQFRELCDQHRARPVVFMARPDALPRYFDLGLIPHKLGEEAVLNLDDSRHLNPAVTALHHSVASSGLRVQVLSAREVAAWLPQMKEVSDEWLASRATGERGFAVGHFDANYLMQLPHALVFRTEPGRSEPGRGEQLVAFASLLCSGQHNELAIDLLRHRSDLPADWVTWLYVELMQWAKQQNYRRFCLGLVPVQDWTDHPLAALWSRIGRTLFLHSRSVEKPEEVRHFKQQFEPHWEERYLMAPGSVPLSQVLSDVSDLMLRDAQRVE